MIPRTSLAPRSLRLGSYLVWVSVVVVVVGPGIVVDCDVVVVLCVVSVEAHADSEKRARAARPGMMSFFMDRMVSWFLQ